jgi:anti-sigma B factor antagonist
MPAVGYNVKTVNGLPVVSAPAEMDASNADELRRLLLTCAGEGYAILVVDMSETLFCDSTGLHQLVRAHKRATRAGGEVRLVIATPTVLRLFAIVGIDGFFPIFKNLDEAVGAPPAPGVRPTSFPGTVNGPVAPGPTDCLLHGAAVPRRRLWLLPSRRLRPLPGGASQPESPDGSTRSPGV